jgi:hypothetical protein
VSGEPVATTVCFLHFAHGLWVQRAPGISLRPHLRVAPAPFFWANDLHNSGVARVTGCSTVSERAPGNGFRDCRSIEVMRGLSEPLADEFRVFQSISPWQIGCFGDADPDAGNDVDFADARV